MRKLGITTASVLVLAAGYSWGYLSHRNQIFPYGLVKELAIRGGLVKAVPDQREIAPAVTGIDSALEALPYIGGTVDPESDRSGVLEHNRERSAPGWNLFSPRLRSEAILVSTDGRVGHRWRLDSSPWQHVEPLPEGGLLVLLKDEGLIRIDSRSRVLWRYEGPVHHDLSVDSAGRIHALTRARERRPDLHPEIDLVVDRIAVLSADGEAIRETSLLDLVLESPYSFVLPDFRVRSFEQDYPFLRILHANHVEVFDGRLAHLSPLFEAGNTLVSLRTPSTVFITDPQRREILWAWGPNNLVYPHHPTLLDNGNLLIFNNGVDRSEVLELEPLERRVVWRYTAEDFYSRTRGSVQRLDNGNTLITESDTGYVFEVTPEGDRVWVFANPFFTEDGERMAIWRMIRLAPDDPRLPPGVS